MTIGRQAPYPVTLGRGRKRGRVKLNFVTLEKLVASVQRQSRPADWMEDFGHTWDQKLLDRWFVEWMMGHPEGQVASRLNRRAALGALGDSVVPQQAYAALSLLVESVL